MKRTFLSAFFVLILPMVISAQAELKVGDTAPDFTLTSVNRKTVKLSDLTKEKPVVLNFWATWCPPCVAEMPDLQKFAANNTDKVTVVAVNAGENVTTVEGFLKRNNYTFTILYDLTGKVSTDYKIYAIPQTFLIGKDNKIKAHHIGGMREKDFEKLLVVK